MTSLLGALLALIGWSVLLIIPVNFAMDPWLFTFNQMMVGGIFLIMVSGKVQWRSSVLQQPAICIYGSLRLATAALFTAALVCATSTTVAFPAILPVPTSALVFVLAWSKTPKTPGIVWARSHPCWPDRTCCHFAGWISQPSPCVHDHERAPSSGQCRYDPIRYNGFERSGANHTGCGVN
ncbi:hypothetical protein [uncultured Roseobacter sp.]|uniref:hypothetical protein n=1 Tax=uncultured Roseobacter sp. TaxID=114847 RepID=UPI00262A355B|nr:hypothetical protein [uncultured Roseobacter sp.]